MNRNKARNACISKFGAYRGERLYYAIERINNLDFCCATGWDYNEISISESCTRRGMCFKLTDDYRCIILNKKAVRIDELTYEDIKVNMRSSKTLPNYKHCFVDD